MHQSVLACKAAGGPVGEVTADDSDDVMIFLSYEVNLPPSLTRSSTLLDAFNAARDVDARVAKPVDDLAERVNRLIARSQLSLVSGAHATLEKLIGSVEGGGSGQERGRALEALLAYAFNQVDGLNVQSVNCRTETEEIDLVVLNDSREVPLSREGSLILVECKNWSDHVPRREVSTFEGKIANRGGRCTVGYFVAWNGFTADARTELLRLSRSQFTIAPIEGAELVESLRGGAFGALLQQSLLRALEA
jgi:hypothetical protein